jgi:superfamily II DNA or RNA helicase
MPILYDHAKKIVDEDKKIVGMFLGTGSTKTRICEFLARGKTLVICPKTQREDKNWEREIVEVRKEMPEFDLDITVISKEQFRVTAHELPRFDTVIGDEAHTLLGATPYVRYENRKEVPDHSQTFEAFRDYIVRTKPDRIYLATATIEKTPMTVWAAGIILGKDWDWRTFRETFYNCFPMGRRTIWTAKEDLETKERLAGVVKSLGYTGRLQDYFDVPEQTFKEIPIKLTEKQKAKLKELIEEYPDPLVQIGKRHQVENGVLSGDEYNDEKIFDNGKIDTILDLSVEFPQMIIFSRYSMQIREIVKALRKDGRRKVFVMDGSVSDRGNLFKEVTACDEYVFVVQSQISAGWEMPKCPVMVFASLSNSIVDRLQAEGRILRANALKKNLYIDLVISDEVKIDRKKTLRSIDRAIYNSIKNKKSFSELVYLKEETVFT